MVFRSIRLLQLEIQVLKLYYKELISGETTAVVSRDGKYSNGNYFSTIKCSNNFSFLSLRIADVGY